jgi:hypothetical protein
MRKILIASAMGMLIAQASVAQDKEHKTIEGNGKLVTRTVDVKSFDALRASGVYELKLSQGNTESVKIEADENLQDLFQVRNDGSKLIIEMEKLKNVNLKSKNKMKVYVTFKKLKDLELSTVGNVSSDKRLAFDDLELRNKSVGNVDLELTANKINVENKSVGNVVLSGKAQEALFTNRGVGSFKAGDFVVQTVEIDNSGIGSAEVNAEKQLKVNDNMLGKVKNKGAAPMRKKNKVVI